MSSILIFLIDSSINRSIIKHPILFVPNPFINTHVLTRFELVELVKKINLVISLI